MRPGRVPDARPESPVLMIMVMRVSVGMGMTGRVLLVPHTSSMAGKTGCSTSIPATLMRLQTPRILRLAEAALGLG